MIQTVGKLENEYIDLVKETFKKFDLEVEFVEPDQLNNDKTIISLTKEATKYLESEGIRFYNWDLLFSVLGPNDTKGEIEKKLTERISIFKSFKSLKSRPIGNEFHGSIRVRELADSTRFYTWLFGIEPKEWTHRYVTFLRSDTKLNFVLLMADDKPLHHDTLYHLGIGADSKDKVIEFYHSAEENNFHIEKPPRTTWRGTPLHELWLKDPDGTLIEIYARLTEDELRGMPEDKEPTFLI